MVDAVGRVLRLFPQVLMLKGLLLKLGCNPLGQLPTLPALLHQLQQLFVDVDRPLAYQHR